MTEALTAKRWWWVWDIIPVCRSSNHSVTFERVSAMPAKDLYHQTVKNALIHAEWTITHDPLTLKLGKKDFYVDLGASQLLAAEKVDRKIAVEIKSFTGRSLVVQKTPETLLTQGFSRNALC